MILEIKNLCHHKFFTILRYELESSPFRRSFPSTLKAAQEWTLLSISSYCYGPSMYERAYNLHLGFD